MIKECRVIMTNDVVSVIRFGDIDVQLPSIHSDEKTVRVIFEKGRYRIVDDSCVDADVKKTQKIKHVKNEKKTTVELSNNEAKENENAPCIDEEH